jgi:fumarylacetoacetate (FAA) hydrolase
MQLVSFQVNDGDQVALLWNNYVYPVGEIRSDLPDNLLDIVWNWEYCYSELKKLQKQIEEGQHQSERKERKKVKLLSPLPEPTSLRDAYAFRQHVKTARENRGVDMIPEFDQFPVFYFTNHNAVYGPGPVPCMVDHFNKLDYELEVAAVIGKQGINIRAEKADEYIAGFMIMNDLSARQLQKEEMKLNLGPAKGKDFANVLGPVMVPADELSQFETSPLSGHTGKAYDLTMEAFVNGEKISEGNMASMNWTFAEIIERVSYGTPIYPGEVIGSGTVGTGCLLEVNGTRKREDPDYTPKWLEPDDEVELRIEQLGRLKNVVRQVDKEYSLLSLKKETQKT